MAKQTLRENAYQHIRHGVANGEFRAGERLYPALLAREMGVSQVPVREAIGQLQSEGLIVHKPHRGIFVKEIERRDLIDLIEFRTFLECPAAANAARRINVAQSRELDERWQELCRAAEALDAPSGTDQNSLDKLWHEWRLADSAFHGFLLRVAGNRRTILAIDDAQVMTRMFAHRVDTPATRRDQAALVAKSLCVHRHIYEAVRRHDAKAARRAMKEHMRCTGRDMLRHFDWLQRQQDADPSLLEEVSKLVRGTVSDIHRSDQPRTSLEINRDDGEETEQVQ